MTVAHRRLLIHWERQTGSMWHSCRMYVQSDLMPSVWYQQLHTLYVWTSAVNSIHGWQQKSAACWEHISVFMCVKTKAVCGRLFKMITNRSREEIWFQLCTDIRKLIFHPNGKEKQEVIFLYYLSIYLSICLSVYHETYLSIYLYIIICIVT